MDRRKSSHPTIRKLKHYFPFIHYTHIQILRKIRNKNCDSYWQHKIAEDVDLALRPQGSWGTAKNPSGFLTEITNTCNLRCVMCNTHLSRREKKHMELEVFSKLLSRLSQEERVQFVTVHTVGEPFCNPLLGRMLSVASGFGIRIKISTNANMPEKLIGLYEDHSKEISNFRFSIDGASKEVYESIRRGGKFEKVLESCRFINEVNRGRRNSRIGLSIACALSKDNLGQIASFFHRFTAYAFSEMITFGLINSLTPDISYFEEKRVEFPNLYRWKVPCDQVFGTMHFNNEGKATLCCRDYDNQLVIGDAINKPLEEVWRSKVANRIRLQHLGDIELDIDQCKNCYGLKPGVNRALNRFLHFMWHEHKEEDDNYWKGRVLDFLYDLDQVLGTNAKDVFPSRFVDRHLH